MLDTLKQGDFSDGVFLTHSFIQIYLIMITRSLENANLCPRNKNMTKSI